MKAKSTAPLFITILFLLIVPEFSIAQSDSTGTFWKPSPPNYEVKQAVEIESLFPMFFHGGWHLGLGYRYEKFRFRVSVINGGDYNADVQSLDGPIDGYKRYYTTSPGIFMGYNVWKNLEVYGYYERHTFEIEQLSTAEKQDISSNDVGIGISYQFFIGRTFYIQPGIHSYFRSEQSTTFANNQTYTIPTFELTPIVRIGARLWEKY
ncbi:hypothetical protein D3C72_749940 [compost metagenome]